MADARIAIVGAGLAGIAAGQTLRTAGCQTVVFEKSRSYGGRCATRNWDGDLVDHGAQYFTVGSSEFARAIRAGAQAAVHPIEAPLVNRDGRPFPEKKRYYHREGNNRLARALAEGLDIRFETPVTPPRFSSGTWEICGENFDRILTTAPLPQSAALFGLPSDEDANYEPCLTLLVRYWGEWLGQSPRRYGLAHSPDDAILWSACENHKVRRIQPGRTVFVLHASAAFSRQSGASGTCATFAGRSAGALGKSARSLVAEAPPSIHSAMILISSADRSGLPSLGITSSSDPGSVIRRCSSLSLGLPVLTMLPDSAPAIT